MASINGTTGKDNKTPTDINSADIVYGLDGNDTINYATSVADNDLIGGNGDDVITGGAGSDTLTGDAGNDQLNGGAGIDTLLGGDGLDTLNGGADDDNLDGGAGNDTLTGGTGADWFSVSAGTDTITDLGNGVDILSVLSGATANVTVAKAFTADDQTINNGTVNLTTADFAVDVSAATGTSGFNITSTGSTGNTLTGSVHDDKLTGGAGNDILKGGAGNNILDGGLGINTAIFDGPSTDYTLVKAPSYVLVTHKITKETNKLYSVNNLEFTDKTVAVINKAPDGTVTISGTATQNQTLTATNSLADDNGLGTISYQWLANGKAITGATASTLTLDQAQVGKAITVLASYTDLLGTAEKITSSATDNVVNINDLPTGTVTITGTASQNQKLTAANSLADVDGLGKIAYQWLANGTDISGATESTLTLGQAQVGKAITVKASYTDLLSTLESVSSTPTIDVINVNHAPTGKVTITGTASQNQTLMATNSLADVDGLGNIAYQWLANGEAISGATTATLTLGQALVGKTITVQAAYTDDLNTAKSVSSTPTTAVKNVNDSPTGTVTITGDAIQNQTLTATNNLADVDGLGNIAYQWLSNGTAIKGATASTLTLGQAQIDKLITVKASYTDSLGTAEKITSLATTKVVHINNLPTGTVTITGIAKQNQTLQAAQSLADVDGLGKIIAYQWRANGTAISGATKSTLILGQAQVGKAITVKAAYTDKLNTAESVSSAETLPVAHVNDAPVLITPASKTYTDTAFDDTFAPYTGSLSASDIDNDILTYGITGGNDNGQGGVAKESAYGTLTVNKATGAYSFEPNDAAIEALKAKASTPFTVTVSDASTSNSKILTINIVQLGTTESTGNDKLTGSANDNKFDGLAGNDTISGLGGNDNILGGSGNDILTGGLGTDILTGGTGKDTFDFNASTESAVGSASDIITDFNHSEVDKIDLAGIDANSIKKGDQAFTYIVDGAFTGVAGQLNYINGILSGDTNGDSHADFEIAITLVGSPSLVSADFVL